jgi:microsomal dipeptidase-like Zn-dependent dipeptidase
MFVDLMCFPKRQMTVPIFDEAFMRPSIIQYTAAPPFMTSAKDIIAETRKTVVQFTDQAGVGIVRSAADLEDPATTIKVVLGLQMPPHDAILADLVELKQLGVHLTTLSFKDDESPYGGGFLSDKPLATKGAYLLEMMRQAGMWLDLSHAGHKTARNAIEVIDNGLQGLVVLATHTGCFSVFNNPRNLPDDVLENIVRLRGVIGLYTLSFGLSPDDDSLVPFIKHLDHMLQVCGDESVALGTDGVYEKLSEAFLRKQVVTMQAKFDADGRMGSRYPVEASVLNTVRKDQILRETLTGYKSPDVVEAIMSGNALGFLQRVL